MRSLWTFAAESAYGLLRQIPKGGKAAGVVHTIANFLSTQHNFLMISKGLLAPNCQQRLVGVGGVIDRIISRHPLDASSDCIEDASALFHNGVATSIVCSFSTPVPTNLSSADLTSISPAIDTWQAFRKIILGGVSFFAADLREQSSLAKVNLHGSEAFVKMLMFGVADLPSGKRYFALCKKLKPHVVDGTMLCKKSFLPMAQFSCVSKSCLVFDELLAIPLENIVCPILAFFHGVGYAVIVSVHK